VKVLVVDPDTRRAPALKETLMAGGVDVTVASSGSFALTMLEWNRHDVVVCRARIDDMDGHELCAILKADPGTRHVRFVLVASATDVAAADTTSAGVDLVLPPTMTGTAILPLIVRLVEADSAPAVDAAGSLPPALPPGPAHVASLPAAPSPSEPMAAPAPPETTRAAPEVPRIRPAPVPPPPADPPKRYATAATAETLSAWPSPETEVSALPIPMTPARPSAPGSTRDRVPSLAAGSPSGPTPMPNPTRSPTSASRGPVPIASRGPAASPPRAPAPARSAAPPQVADLLAMPSGTFQGSMEVLELADLTQAIAGGGKSGRLILALPQGGGLVLFEKGRVVHAEYCNTVGEEAFAALLAACHADGAGRFCFLPSPAGEPSGLPRTIDKAVDRLLLSSATAIDEKG
jgi:CheY-like chemotaxis protein